SGIVEYNESFLEMFGYSTQEVAGKSALELNIWADPLDRERMVQLLKSKGKIRNQESIYRRKNGEIFPALCSASLLQINNQPLILIAARDITISKQTEEALIENETTYRALINGMDESAWVIDFDGNFLDVNNAAIEMLRYSRDELLSLGIKGIDSYLTTEEVQNLTRHVASGVTQVFETIHRTKDGTQIPVEISSSLITYHGKHA